jgi:pimeloyl-ACP methyl ester carboxylesterase
MVVYLHGNASARVEVLPQLSFLLASGIWGVCSIDFTGSGHSDGDYVSLGYYERYDLECVLQYLQQTYGTGNNAADADADTSSELEIVLWGRSMGASTALMHASEKTRTVMRNQQQQQNAAAAAALERQNFDAYPDETTVPYNLPRNPSHDSINDHDSSHAFIFSKTNQMIKGLICDSPFASLPQLCEELVEKARAQGVVVPGIVVSVALAMIARSVSNRAHFSIHDISPVQHVPSITTPALFIVGADDDFIPPHHSEDLCAAYGKGISTNLLMVPGGHNDARPLLVFDAIGQFLQYRLSLTGSMMLTVPDVMLDTYHQRPPWAFAAYGHSVFQVHALTRKRSTTSTTKKATSNTTNTNNEDMSARAMADEFGMTKQRQDDIQNKLHLMLGQQQTSSAASSSPPPPAANAGTGSSVTLPTSSAATAAVRLQNGSSSSKQQKEVVAMGVPIVATGVPFTNNTGPGPTSQHGGNKKVAAAAEEVDLIDLGGGPKEAAADDEVDLIDFGDD